MTCIQDSEPSASKESFSTTDRNRCSVPRDGHDPQSARLLDPVRRHVPDDVAAGATAGVDARLQDQREKANAPIEPEVLKDIHRRAGRLVATGKFRPDEYDDLVQEMIMAWLCSRSGYDCKRKRAAFANVVTQNCVTQLLRDRRTASFPLGGTRMLSLDRPLRGRGQEQPELGDVLGDEDIWGHQSTTEQEEQRDLAIDVAEVLATLPEGLRELAEQLMHFNVTEIAERTGEHRTKAYEGIAALRRHLKAAGLDKYLPTHFGEFAQKEKRPERIASAQ